MAREKNFRDLMSNENFAEKYLQVAMYHAMSTHFLEKFFTFKLRIS